MSSDTKEELIAPVLADLLAIHGRATPGTWAQGTSSHHTVSKREGQPDYHIANFHHADDASFIDTAHKYMPLLIKELEAVREELEALKEHRDRVSEYARKLLLDRPSHPKEDANDRWEIAAAGLLQMVIDPKAKG